MTEFKKETIRETEYWLENERRMESIDSNKRYAIIIALFAFAGGIVSPFVTKFLSRILGYYLTHVIYILVTAGVILFFVIEYRKRTKDAKSHSGKWSKRQKPLLDEYKKDNKKIQIPKD